MAQSSPSTCDGHSSPFPHLPNLPQGTESQLLSASLASHAHPPALAPPIRQPQLPPPETPGCLVLFRTLACSASRQTPECPGLLTAKEPAQAAAWHAAQNPQPYNVLVSCSPSLWSRLTATHSVHLHASPTPVQAPLSTPTSGQGDKGSHRKQGHPLSLGGGESSLKIPRGRGPGPGVQIGGPTEGSRPGT